MEDDDGVSRDWCSIRGSEPTAAAIGDEYAAFVRDGRIYIQKLESLDEQPRRLPHRAFTGRTTPILAASHHQSHLLAASHGYQIPIVDLITGRIRQILPGISRTVTALAWSTKDASIIATGSIDGSICVWNLGNPSQPLCRLSNNAGACRAITYSPADDGLLASIDRRNLSVWNPQYTYRPIFTVHGGRTEFDALVWLPTVSERLVVSTSNGELRLYGLPDRITTTLTANSPDSSDPSDSDDGIFGHLDGISKPPQLFSMIPLEDPLRQLISLDDHGVLGLAKNGQQAFIYGVQEDGAKLVKTWSCKLENTVGAVQLQIGARAGLLVEVGDGGVETDDVPSNVLDTIGRQDKSTPSPSPLASARHVDSGSRLDSLDATVKAKFAKTEADAIMKPIAISAQRHDAAGFAKISKQLQQKHRLSRRTSTGVDVTAETRPVQSTPPSTPPQPRSISSSLELPNSREEGLVESPMPFLSPSIPSRRASPNDIPPLDESEINLPQLPKLSFDSSIPSTAIIGHDSDDSDDETFVDGMQGSGTFLPGSINVPLPKACGALFAPNGQLLTFFPPRPKPAPAPGDVEAEAEPSKRQGDASKVAKLFPTFGNLYGGPRRFSADSDSECSGSIDENIGGVCIQPSFNFQSSSFPDQQSWRSRISPTKAGFESQRHSEHNTIVSVHDVSDVQAIYPSQRRLAEDYHILCKDGESGSELCQHNASAAENAGLLDVAEVWRLISMLLEDVVPLEVFSGGTASDDLLLIARRAKMLTQPYSVSELRDAHNHGGPNGKLRWADHPFGASWLVRRVLEWAEQRADVQLLACVSAILAEAEDSVPVKNPTTQQAMLTKLPTYYPPYFANSNARPTQGRLAAPAVPVLRTDTAANTSAFYESPVKLQHSSTTSSRNASQPATPYLDSNTPPLPLPALSRQVSNRVSASVSGSGSASPEFQRSSFSAAAKYYAQSITDRFASNGTSPPNKKSSTSPSTSNELSASLPNGSWGKSVSFAISSTTADTARGSLLSRSYDGHDDEQAYDSDKTVEDSSAPHTPKSPSGAITVALKNQSYFADEVSGSARAKLAPEELAVKGEIWCQHYAKQLRCWDLLLQATELEKIFGITSGGSTLSAFADESGKTGVQPTARIGQSSRSCAICLTATRGMDQICPACFHTSHLSCLDEYSEDTGDGEFTCPAGCGCACSELPYVAQHVLLESPPARPIFKKKASFTDPRWWRARVEGDSW